MSPEGFALIKEQNKRFGSIIHDPPVASADTPLGQWFSNYFDHDPKKEETQYTKMQHTSTA